MFLKHFDMLMKYFLIRYIISKNYSGRQSGHLNLLIKHHKPLFFLPIPKGILDKGKYLTL